MVLAKMEELVPTVMEVIHAVDNAVAKMDGKATIVTKVRFYTSPKY